MAKTSATTDIVVNKIYPIIEKSIEKNTNSYMQNLQRFIEVRSKDLYSNKPCSRIFFGSDDVDRYFASIKVKESEVLSLLKEAYYFSIPSFNPRAATDPLTIAQMCVIRYFCLKNNRNKAEISAIYLAFSGKFYPSIHRGKFKYLPNEDVMEYVVNMELNNKYDLKREGTVFGAVKSICQTWLDTYWDKFTDPDDEDIADLIQQLHSRIKSFLGNICAVYMKIYQDKDKYLRYESDSEEEGNYHIADNDSLRAERYVENTMNRLTSRSVDFALCKMASDANVKTDEIKSIIESIQDEPQNLPIIKEYISLIVYDYMAHCTDKRKLICTPEFISYSIAVKPNSKDKNIIRQREILELFLNENSPGYRKRKSRAATKSSYFKSVNKYYVLLIYESNKGK